LTGALEGFFGKMSFILEWKRMGVMDNEYDDIEDELR